jgi:protein-tyrosine phosphatase
MNLRTETSSNSTGARVLQKQKETRIFTDIHCHCLPGLDDGPSDETEAVALCRALADDSITTVVATPHQLGRYDGLVDARGIRQAVERLNSRLSEASIPLTVLPGADVRLDERIVRLLRMGKILTVADLRRYLMLELPHEVFIDPQMLLAQLGRAGIRAVLSHPERHPALAMQPHSVQRWTAFNPCLQITAGSFLGEFGPLCEEAAWAFLDEPLPVLVATDAHGTHYRPPRMSEAYRLISSRRGRDVADTLCIENPRRLVAGQDLLPSDGPARPRSALRKG